MPYSLPHCDHYTNQTYKPCSNKTAPTPQCVPTCEPGYPKTYKEDKHFGIPPHTLTSEAQIMDEVAAQGSVTAVFTVYSDFLSYKSGIYKHITGKALGGHAVKIIGFGIENYTAYWLVANSWNVDWGDKGFFKIHKGFNECGIESAAVVGYPRD